MIPDADIVAMSGSVSNHCCRNSVALIVISWTNVDWRRSGRSRKVLARPTTGIQSNGLNAPGSGGTTDRIGLMNRAMSAIRSPYSS